MWRIPSSSRFLFRSAICVSSRVQVEHPIRLWRGHPFCNSTSQDPEPNPSTNSKVSMSFAEAKRLMRHVDVEELKRKLGTETEETIKYSELLHACEALGVAKTREEAVAFAKVLDDAGVILLFRDKVYLHPNKVVDLVRRAVPLALTPENDPRREELKQLKKKKEEIDLLAHKQVRRVLWSGLGFLVVQISLFFRLTFWEFSWDVMEPIAFFGTTAGLLLGYAYFLFTSRDPTYQDLRKRLFLLRQKKLYQKKGFNLDRYLELQNHCKCPLDRDGESEAHMIQEKEKLI